MSVNRTYTWLSRAIVTNTSRLNYFTHRVGCNSQKSNPGFFKDESGFCSSPGLCFSRVRIFLESESGFESKFGPGFEVCLNTQAAIEKLNTSLNNEIEYHRDKKRFLKFKVKNNFVVKLASICQPHGIFMFM